MSNRRPWRWDNGVRGCSRLPHLGSHRDDHFKLVDVLPSVRRAAPIYRSLAAVDVADVLGGHYVFADGGLWANNPVLVGLIDDAILMAPADRPIEDAPR